MKFRTQGHCTVQVCDREKRQQKCPVSCPLSCRHPAHFGTVVPAGKACWDGSSCSAGVITSIFPSFIAHRTGPELYPPLSMSLTWTTSSTWVPLLTSRAVGVSLDWSACWLVLAGWSSDHCCPVVSSDSDSRALWCGLWLVTHRKDCPRFPGNTTPTPTLHCVILSPRAAATKAMAICDAPGTGAEEPLPAGGLS